MEQTSTNAPLVDKSTLDEAEFLQQEADDAKKAALRALGELKSRVAAGVDPRGWVEDHPWLTLGGVAAASFVATSMAVPSKEQQALKKIAAIEAAIRRESGEKKPPASNGHGPAPEKEPRSLLAVVLLEVLGVIKPMLGEFFASLVRQPPPPDPDQEPPPP